jgi:hypothetical protein
MANGLSKGMSIGDIAKKHKMDVDILKQELKKGIKVEKEHTSDVRRAARIAMDHLFEDPKYYTKLAKLNLEIKVKIYPGGQGADVDYDERELSDMATSDIPLNMLVLNEPASKMLEPESKIVLKNLIEKVKEGKQLPPIIVRKLGNKYQIVDGHHRYFANKILGKDRIRAIIVDPQDVEILKENLNKDLVKDFMKHVMDELHLDKLPKITLSNNSQDAIDLRSWGGYQPSSKSIHIVIAGRHAADIFRTLAHELVHYKQDLEGRLKPDSGKTGSEDENEANSRAAVIMRNFAQAKPNLFEHLINEVGQIQNPFDWGLVDIDDDGNYFYRFNTPNNEYSVGVTYNGAESYELSFSTLGEMGQDTGEGVAMKVLSTVMEIAISFVAKEKPNELIFRPIKTKGEEDKRRFNVYGAYLRANTPKEYNLITLGDTYRWIRK